MSNHPIFSSAVQTYANRDLTVLRYPDPPLHIDPPAPNPRTHTSPALPQHTQLSPRGPNTSPLRPPGAIPRRHPAHLPLQARHDSQPLSSNSCNVRHHAHLHLENNLLPTPAAIELGAAAGESAVRGRGVGGGVCVAE